MQNNRAEGASLLPQAVGGSAQRLEPTLSNFPFREPGALTAQEGKLRGSL